MKLISRYKESIRVRLALHAFATTGLAVILASAAFIASDFTHEKNDLVRHATLLADAIGLGTADALRADDPEGSRAAITLTLSAEGTKVSTVVYDADGRIFTRYPMTDEFVEPDLPPSGERFVDDRYEVVRSVAMDGENLGTVFLSLDSGKLLARTREIVGIGILVLLLAGVIAWMGASRLNASLVAPLRALAQHSESLAAGDLRSPTLVPRKDEIGLVSNAFDGMTKSLRALLVDIRGHMDSVRAASSALTRASVGIHKQVAESARAAEGSFESIDEIKISVGEVRSNVESVSAAAAQTAEASTKMDESIRSVAGNVEELAHTIDETSGSVLEITETIGVISQASENLSEATSETEKSVSNLEQSVARIESGAEKSQSLASQAADRAQRGGQGVSATISSMKAIQDGHQSLADRVNRLAEKSERIGSVTQVIQEVMDQTNLLALNAAIIAAQAGEHGRPFGVVADEVKNLARRTAESTDAITRLIADVRGEVAAVVESMSASAKQVADGVERSEEAGRLLYEIGASANECREIAGDIAIAATEQASSVNGVNRSVERLRAVVAQIDRSVRDQHEFSSGIHSGVSKMRSLGKSVRDSTLRQQSESELIASSSETVAERLHLILEAMEIQAEQHDRIALALDVFRETAAHNTEGASEVQRTVAALECEHESLDRELSRFRL